MVSDYVKRVLIVDDQEQDIAFLRDALNELNVLTIYKDPKISNLDIEEKLPPVQLVFMDFKLSGNDDDRTDLSLIRRYLESIPDNTAYGLVLWTSNFGKLSLLKETIDQDLAKADMGTPMLYPRPAFIIGIDKAEIESRVNPDSAAYLKFIEDKINADRAAQFFFTWMTHTEAISQRTLLDLFSLLPNYTHQNEDFLKLISQLVIQLDVDLSPSKDGSLSEMEASGPASENSGAGSSEKEDCLIKDSSNNTLLTRESFHILDKLFYSKLKRYHYMSDPLPLNFVSEQQQNTSEAKQKESKKDGAESDRIALKQFASLNSLLYIDCSQQASELSQSKILPGSVYYYQHGQYEIGKVSVSQRCAAFPIAIEVSPPCDFVNGKKVLSRLICGFIMSIKKDIGDGQNQSGKSGKGNKEGQKNSLDTLNQKKLAYAFIVGPFANSLLDSLKKIGTLEHITVAALKANASTQNPAQPADEPCSDDAYQNAAESLEVISEKSPSSVSLCYLALNLNHLISVPDEKLLENKEFRFLFRIENDVFADVLQKFSSHASRLGNSLLQLPSNKSKKG